jgi:hypothetical protein
LAVRGTITHWDGGGWSSSTTGTSHELLGVWGSAPANVWAVGGIFAGPNRTGTIVHWDGGTWSSSFEGGRSQLFAVWGSASGDVWVVGAAGAILHHS